MYYGLYMSAAGAHAQSQRVEVLSNNLANVDTVGFKKELALLEARDSEAIERGLAERGSRTVTDVGGGIRMPITATNYGLGALRQTNFRTDFALEDPSQFFLVQRGNDKLLTRAGNFTLDTEGRLLTQSGDAVLDSDEKPIQLDPLLPFRMLPGGTIDQFGDRVELGIAKPTSRDDLHKVGSNYFAQPGGKVELAPEAERRVRHGWQELSSVNPVQEMVEMIAAQRTYEANVRLIQQHDGATSSLIGRMLRA
jgi:flagellar basal-body rod protein FlgF/flagellar basal-body rod protein FlgG